MSQSDQTKSQEAYPAPSTGYAAMEAPHIPPPPAGYPTRDDVGGVQPHSLPPSQTQFRGEGFWKGCCAGLCCCCLLDACC
ncbi:hypothetical protein NMG60_11019314 [Bertholletia excelsa]